MVWIIKQISGGQNQGHRMRTSNASTVAFYRMLDRVNPAGGAHWSFKEVRS